MDAQDRLVIDTLQDSFPVCERPFLAVAQQLGMSEDELIARVDRLLADGTLTRFGPLFNADRLGGENTLCAMQVPRATFAGVAARVNALPAVAHNYEREHALNMWFVLATESADATAQAIGEVEQATGLPVHAFAKEREYFVRLKLSAAP
ncbi:MAG: AsnC family transcriptional regulator [Burkholderiales bacterium]|nr:AsnC family transcriptional regulator [Burkholderiales bacterium]